MNELLNGLLWCDECGMPLLSDDKGQYAHIHELSFSRIRQLIREPSIADKLADWFINLKGVCSDCGKEHFLFARITKKEFVAHVASPTGADDFARAIKDFLREE